MPRPSVKHLNLIPYYVLPLVGVCLYTLVSFQLLNISNGAGFRGGKFKSSRQSPTPLIEQRENFVQRWWWLVYLLCSLVEGSCQSFIHRRRHISPPSRWLAAYFHVKTCSTERSVTTAKTAHRRTAYICCSSSSAGYCRCKAPRNALKNIAPVDWQQENRSRSPCTSILA